MEKKMKTTMMCNIGTTAGIHSFIPSLPKVRVGLCWCLRGRGRGNVGFRVWGLGLGFGVWGLG